jgi:hypothetical protein
LNVRFPKLGAPVPEATKTDKRQLAEASRLLKTVGLVPGRDKEREAAETIDKLLDELEKPQPAAPQLPFEELKPEGKKK